MRRILGNRTARRVAALSLLALAGCVQGSDGGQEALPAPEQDGLAAAPLPPVPIDTAPAADTAPREDRAAPADTVPDAWTVGIVDRRRPGVRMTVLQEVRTARHPDFDRVVFQFAGTEIPGYHLEYVDRPVRQCGSGDPVAIAGDGWLSVRMEPSQAHDDQGRATVQDRARAPELPNLLELRATCDFEGQVEWVLGVASPNRFRVMELRSPARLVVDVRH